MDWTAEQRKIADKYKKLDDIPEKERKYKCHTCHLIVDENPCPNCGETHLELMCPLDHCHCNHEIISGIEYCPLCGQAVCPECGSHDVVQVSRVTGYLQDVSGWNAGKRQELKDRMRYSVA
jgi:RNA polymerase subunit RPABC4/transcription elongation factor Spt4